MDTSMHYYDLKTIRRSLLRQVAGKLWYRFMRYAQWYFGKVQYAYIRKPEPLPYICVGHSTPLIRNLPGAAMELQRNKITNLTLAAAKLNGIVLRPGETFSFWKLVGKPTKRKGYLPGMILTGGKISAGTGGGLCQIANLVYWMALHTELTVTERHRHSYDVFPDSNRTQPFGSGATCAYNYMDLQIVNNTDSPYQLLVSVTDGFLQGTWRSAAPCKLCYRVYERDARIIPSAWGGYFRHNAIWRTTRDEMGVILRDEKITENNALMMYAPLLPQSDSSTPDVAGPLQETECKIYQSHPFSALKPQYPRNALQSLYH